MSRWAIHHPIAALVVWFAVLFALVGGAVALGDKYNNSFALPGAQSTMAQDLLERLPAADSQSSSFQVVWSPTSGKATDAAVKAQIKPLLEELSRQVDVTCVVGPYQENFGRDCPKPAPANVTAALTTEANEKIAAALGVTSAELTELMRALPAIYPLAKVKGEDLSEIATVLAWLAHADEKDWAAIARKIPHDVAKLHAAVDAGKAKFAEYTAAAQAAADATSPVSKDQTVAYATVTLDTDALSAIDATHITNLVADANSATLTVGVNGQALAGAGGGADSSEAVGLLVAIVILLLAFGSLVAAGLPIVVALTGLVGGQVLIVILSNVMDVASFAPTLAAMIGLGVGIDYSLFIMNRYRQSLDELAPKEAAVRAVQTAGRAVMFAGCTVIIALLGMFVLNINFFNGLSMAAAVTVLMVMLSALLMLPALLSLLGTKALAIKMPWARRHKEIDPDDSRWSSYGRLLQRMPAIPLVLSVVVIGALASPALTMELGFPDNGTQAPGTPLRNGFDLLTKGYGQGVAGPFFVAVELKHPRDMAELATVVSALEKTEGVASTLPNSKMLLLLDGSKTAFDAKGTLTSVLVQPTTSPQDEATADTLARIRDVTAPEVATSATLYVGGTQAISTDFTAQLQKMLPIFLLLVVGLGFLALMLLFHSLVIPLTAAVTSLMSFAGALGITVAVFQHGTLASVLDVTGTGPILPFLPIMVFAILFGLSMDYQVFLVTRMQEEWHKSGDNRIAVRRGLAGSGKVVVIAATIMTSVFLSFVPTPNDTIKLFGVALASAVIIDAFLVRLVLVPSLMSLLGRANWWLPKWLNKALPRITLD